MARGVLLAVLLLLLLVPAPGALAATVTVDCAAAATGLQPLGAAAPQATHLVQRGESLSSIARRYAVGLSDLIYLNGIRNPNLIYVGQRVQLPERLGSSPVAAPFEGIWMEGNARQGEAVTFWVQVQNASSVTGWIGEQRIEFRPLCGRWWGLAAFDAMLDEPGSYRLDVRAVGQDGATHDSRVTLTLADRWFPWSPALVYPQDRQHLLQRERVQAEHRYVDGVIAAQPSRPPLWSAPFILPLDSYVTNVFGHMGMRNGQFVGYHEGIDYRGRVGTSVLAPAPGVVILAEGLEVRGNTIFVDHGAGVVTGYFHLSQIEVASGDVVYAGQQIGQVGATGLVTGPHLHWELRVNGRWVDPLPFTRTTIP